MSFSRKAGNNGGYFRRKVTVRHEKKGWGVLDIGGPTGVQVIERDAKAETVTDRRSQRSLARTGS